MSIQQILSRPAAVLALSFMLPGALSCADAATGKTRHHTLHTAQSANAGAAPSSSRPIRARSWMKTPAN